MVGRLALRRGCFEVMETGCLYFYVYLNVYVCQNSSDYSLKNEYIVLHSNYTFLNPIKRYKNPNECKVKNIAN